MRVRDVMSARPIVVGGGATEVRRLMDLGGVHHMPVVEGGRLIGVWVSTGDGPLVMMGPGHVHETTPEADAASAMRALSEGAEAVLVWDSGIPAGLLTRSDLMEVVRTAMGRGVGRRHPRPVVARLIGPAGCGKTTLIVRTLALLGRLEVAVVQGNADAGGGAGRLAGARVVDAPDAHWRAGLGRTVERLSDAQLILVEDRDGPLEPGRGIGEDIQVLVVPAASLAEMRTADLEEVAALVVSQADGQPEAALADMVGAVHRGRPGLRVFVTAAGHDDRGLEAWALWLEGQVLRRRG